MGDAAGPLWAALEPYLGAEGVELDDLELVGTGPGRVLRVTIDASGGIDVDRVASLARGISPLLDEHDALQGGYTLEVSTPGLERKLRRPHHFVKSIGREVVAKTHAPVAGVRAHRGELEEADGAGFVLKTDDGSRRIEYDQLASARTVFHWEPAVKPGKRR
jgi:ribosome maturation factor RimP